MKELRANSRFLFDNQIVEEINIAKALSKVDEIIFNSVHLEMAYNEIIIDFRFSPSEAEFLKSEVSLGREIVGYDSEAFEILLHKDYSRNEVQKFELKSFGNWEEIYEEVVKTYSFRGSWRLVLKDDFSDIYFEVKK